MKVILTAGAFAATLMCGMALAQSTTPSTDQTTPQTQTPSTQTSPQTTTAPTSAPTEATPAATPNQAKIAPGSVIPVQLTKTIDAKKAKTGDEVVAKVTMDMKNNTGEVIVPKDTKITGHVTEAQARSKEQKESQLAIAFDQAMLKDQQVQLPMSIQAVVGQENNNSNNDSAGGPSGAAPSPSSTGTNSTSPMAGRSPTSGGQGTPQASGSPDTPNGGGGQDASAGKRPQINGQTQGVIGIQNLNLSPNSNAKQGSTLTSEKNNVKLESGTMLLLRVNQ
jgi:hypothetical protein